MRRITVSATQFIGASPKVVYVIIADYRNGHPRILPKQYFGWLRVEAGGVGAGTRIRFEMRILGRSEVSQAEVTEPEPGCVLVETIPASGIVSTFTVDADPHGGANATVMELRGIEGWVQGWLVPPLLGRIYREELQNLANLAPVLAAARVY